MRSILEKKQKKNSLIKCLTARVGDGYGGRSVMDMCM